MALDLAAEAARLQTEAAQHKRAIGHHRRRLQEVMTTLAHVKAECQRRGIHLIHVNPNGEEGDLHGRRPQ